MTRSCASFSFAAVVLASRAAARALFFSGFAVTASVVCAA